MSKNSNSPQPQPTGDTFAEQRMSAEQRTTAERASSPVRRAVPLRRWSVADLLARALAGPPTGGLSH